MKQPWERPLAELFPDPYVGFKRPVLVVNSGDPQPTRREIGQRRRRAREAREVMQ